MSGSSHFQFRPMTRDDLSMMYTWLNLPHVKAWWGENTSSAEVEKEFIEYIDGVEPIVPYIVLLGERAIGHTQWMRYADYAWYAKILGIPDDELDGAANCDVFIGEADLLYQGLGNALVRQFTDEIIFADPRVKTCFIDPEATNKAAIRAYEKAGFAFLREVPDHEGDTVHLMSRARPASLK